MLSAANQAYLLRLTGADSLGPCQLIQPLWGGYGELLRVQLSAAIVPSVIVKQVSFPQPSSHPRGWDGHVAHQRKLRSYQVEAAWYQHYAPLAAEASPLASCMACDIQAEGMLLVLEDLSLRGFTQQRQQIEWPQLQACIEWLAAFHARYLQLRAPELWEQGCYWHLATRPDELAAMEASELKQRAAQIDQALSNSDFFTLVHGDAKLANFLFNEDGEQVAAVDFQYVGRGCGMRDLALFIGSCMDQEQCFVREQEILEHYFECLRESISAEDSYLESVLKIDFELLEEQWRARWPLAWADFERFLLGWSPGHWKLNQYSEQMTRRALLDLDGVLGDD